MNEAQEAIKLLAEANGMAVEVRPKSITESGWFKSWRDMGFPGRSMDVSINPAHKWQGDGTFFDNGFRDLALHAVSVEAMDLMKAAPDLLEAAEGLQKNIYRVNSDPGGVTVVDNKGSRIGDVWDRMLKAIAKAKGVDNE